MMLRAGPATPGHGNLLFPMPRPSVAASVARSILTGPFTPECVMASMASLRTGRRTKALTNLANRLVAMLGEGRRPRQAEVAEFLQARADFHRLFPVAPNGLVRDSMQPAAGAPEQWQVPALITLQALADWLQLTPQELHWLRANRRADHEKPAHHYRCRWIPRRGRPPRLIEAPLPVLKRVQQRILHGLLDRFPAHPAAHGFIRGRNIVSFTTPHAGQRCVLRMDIEDFFSSIRRARVLRVFLTAGYPETVAAALADLCTTVTPASVRQHAGDSHSGKELVRRRRLQERHLPQGAPTSPALANLCAFSLDHRLSGLARVFGAIYTRYADDLLLSGDEPFRRDVRRCEVVTAAVLLEEGFAAAHRKTRIMPSSVSQQAAGLVLNKRPALPRRERDQLKAILTNCQRHGPDSQNRAGHGDFRAHLEGRVAHAAHVHPASGVKLRALLDAITWA